MHALSVAWTYVKKFWSLALLIIGAVVAFVLFRRKESTFVDRLQQINALHAEEIQKINSIREEEARQHEANLKQLQDTLDMVQRRYDEAKRNLDDKKRREVEDIVKRFSNDPDALAKKLSEATGFKIVMPG